MLHLLSMYNYKKMAKVLCERERNGEIQIPDKETPIEIDKNANLTFVVFGDPQVSNYMYARQCCFYSACLDIGNMKEPLDALILAGDIAENGMQCEYDTVSRILSGISGNFTNFLACPGNHDVRLRPYRKQLRRFTSFVNSIDSEIASPTDSYSFSCEMNGYKFIVMGTDFSTFEGSYISKKQLMWLEREIASTQGTGKPVFVINHQALKRTHGLPDVWQGIGNWRGSIGWQSNKVRAVFEKFDNVIFITGHLHFGTYENTYQDCGKFKSISVQTVSANNHGKTNDLSQGMVFSVYDDRVVVRARKFGAGKYYDENTPNYKIEIKV